VKQLVDYSTAVLPFTKLKAWLYATINYLSCLALVEALNKQLIFTSIGAKGLAMGWWIEYMCTFQ
jgi:hypothetical protein